MVAPGDKLSSEIETVFEAFLECASRICDARPEHNRTYPILVAEKLKLARALIASGQPGEVTSVVAGQPDQIKPVAEAALGAVLDPNPDSWIDEYGEYRPGSIPNASFRLHEI